MTTQPRIALIGECMIELQHRADGSLHQSFGGDTLNTRCTCVASWAISATSTT